MCFIDVFVCDRTEHCGLLRSRSRLRRVAMPCCGVHCTGADTMGLALPFGGWASVLLYYSWVGWYEARVRRERMEMEMEMKRRKRVMLTGRSLSYPVGGGARLPGRMLSRIEGNGSIHCYRLSHALIGPGTTTCSSVAFCIAS